LLLNRNPAKRLGSGPTASLEIKNHEFFADIDWDKVHKREYPVMQPKVKNLTTNAKAVQQFFSELEESETRFRDY
jgi:classical protein kinase C alpha type